jgi:hypothetical protein
MTTKADLDSAINNILTTGAISTVCKLSNDVAEKAYEAYIFSLCLRAVRELGGTPVLRSINGKVNPNPFIFRGSPSQIHSTHKNYGYAEFTVNKERFEVHAGVEFEGTSKTTHEMDVAVMKAEEAEKCRKTRSDPAVSAVIGAWECKFYGGSLQKHLGRAFVGLIDDAGTVIRLSGLCSNSDSSQLRLYFMPQRRPFPHFKLSPLNKSNEDVFVNALKGELKKMAGA